MARQIYNDTWASGGDIVDPGAVKTTLGWVVEAPPHEFFNFWQGQTDEMLQHIERNGISEFNAATIYDLGGYAREGTVVFRSLVAANTGNLPSTSPTEWVKAFFKTSEAAGLDVANVFTANQTIKRSSATTTLDLDADTGFDTFINFKENSVRRADMFYDESQDFFRILKRDTDGNTVKCDLQFQNDGDVDLATGILKVAGNLVFHQGNDGPGSGLDADTVDGIEAAAIAQLSVANVFTQEQTLKKAAANTFLSLDADTGFDTNIIFKENNVQRTTFQYDESVDVFKIKKFDTNGTTVKSDLQFQNDGDVDLVIGILKVAGNLVFHAGNDGAGSGLDADLLDGIEGANYARIDQANVFTEDQTIKDAGDASVLNIDADTGFDTFVIFKENAVKRAQLQYDESVDIFKLSKLDTNGTTVKALLEFKNDGDINVTTGTLKQAGSAVLTLLTGVDQDSETGAANNPVGTTAQRPANGAGKFRFNSTLGEFEGNDGTDWASVGGGAVGASGNPIFWENDTNVTGDYTITTGSNAGSFGPITIDSGVTVTVPSGSEWSIV